jgi:signal transduction histidine kinase
MKIRLQLLIGFLVLILVFATVFFINQRLSQEVLTNTNYLNNSETVIRNSNILHKEIIEMQSGFRGFLLTTQESFLQPYYDGLKSVPVLIEEQRGLLSNLDQQLRLDSVNELHKDWIVYADSLISSKKDTLPESTAKYQRMFEKKLRMEVGKRLNDKIHTVFVSLDNYEYNLRQNRRTALQASIKSTRDISLTLIIVSIIFVVVSSFFLVRTITARISKMIILAEKISGGEFISIADTRKDEFASLVDSLNQMSETLDKNFKELKKKNQELDQFAYVVSHDLKAPLRGVTNIISWIEEDHANDLTPDIKNNLELIKGRTNRLENMINGLLEYARVGKIKKGTEQVDVEKLLSEIRELIVPDNIVLTTDGDLPVIYTEKLYLEQVFSNLISNAIKHNSAAEPVVKIKGTDKGDYYEFSVSDNGPGIEEQYFEKIFVIFQTLQERDAFESTGVGLAIVKKIIEDHKGTIHVESKMGKGTTFVFTWPKTEQNKKG